MNKKIKSITIRGEEDKTKGYVFPHEKKKKRISYMHKRLTFKVGALINVHDIKKEVWSKNDDEAELIEALELDEVRRCLMIFTKSRSILPILISLDEPFLEHYEPDQ
jgi:hypothetical protein